MAGLETPWPSLNAKMGPMAKGDLIYLSGKPKCVPKNTKLLTNIGLVSIEEIFNHHNILLDDKERTEDVTSKKVFVDTSDGRKQVTHFTINGKKELLEIQTKLGLSIKVTKNHPLRVMSSTGILEWVNAENLKINDYLVVNRNICQGGEKDLISKEEARFIGYLVADGCLSNSYTNSTHFSNSNQDVINDYVDCIYYINTKLKVIQHAKKDSNGIDHFIHSKKFRQFTKTVYGLEYVKAAGKCIPLVVRSSSSKIWKEFLSAYFECESYINTTRNCIEVTSASKKLIDDVQLMLLSLGIVSRQRIKKVKGYEQLYHELVLPSDEAIKFIRTIGYISKKQKEKATILLQNNSTKRNKSNDTIPYQQGFFLDIQKTFPTDREWNHITNKIIRGIRDPSHSLLERIIDYINSNGWNVPICKYWETIRNMYFDTITSIENTSEENTYDLTQPDTREFTGNGLVVSNSGKTTLALNICYNLSYHERLPTLLFCLEMAPERLGQKLVSLHRGIDVTNQEILLEDIQLARTSLTKDGEPIPLYFGYSADKSILYDTDALIRIFKLAKRKYGLALIVFDNIQYLCRSTTNVPQIVAKLSRDFKLMAMDFRIPVIAVAQPVKLGNEQIMTASHLRDSGSLEADADTVLILNRNRYVESALNTKDLQSDQIESGVTRVAVDRTRYSRGGFTSLFLEGGKSLFREATDADLMGDNTT